MTGSLSNAPDPRLAESEARYHALIENASDMIQSVRRDGTFEFVNRAWYQTLKYEPEDLSHMTMWDTIHPDSREHCEIAFARTMHGKPVEYVRAIFITKDGDPIPVEGSATVRVLDGEVIATHGFFRDIRERLRAEALEERNQELERERIARYLEKMAALGKLAAGLAHELNNPASAAQRAATGLIQALASRDTAAFGLTQQRLRAEHWHYLNAEVASALERKGDSPVFSPLEASDHESDVEDWLSDLHVSEAWNLAPVLVSAGICEDQLKEVANHIPVDALPAAVQWIAESITVVDLAHVISRSSSRMSELVGAVKAYSYMDRAADQTVDIHEGIENTLIILAHRLKGMRVVRDYDRTIPPVRAFGSGLNQVWTNLIDNAADATGNQGSLTIRTRRDGGRAIVSIIDDGAGISKEDLTRIFEPFFTTKTQGSGTGLGLDTAWRIITEEHHGMIDVESEPGHTEFRVALPLSDESIINPVMGSRE